MLGDLVVVVLVVFCKMGAMPDIKVQLMHEKTPSKEKSYELWIDVCLSHYTKLPNHQIQRDKLSLKNEDWTSCFM